MTEPDVLDDLQAMSYQLALVGGSTYSRHEIAAVMMLASQEIIKLRNEAMKPRPINKLPHEVGMGFIGLTLEHTIEGKPMWELDHYQFVDSGGLINRNSSNDTNMLKRLTHWLPEPEFP